MNSDITVDTWKALEKKLELDGAHQTLIRSFRRHYDFLTKGHTGLIPQSTISPVGWLPTLDEAGATEGSGVDALQHAVVIKLNGGLGTGMGLNQAKSLLPVKNGLTFLDIIAGQILCMRQIHECRLPLIFMNSFSTHADTLAALNKHPDLVGGQDDIPISFVQNRVPKISCENFQPVEWKRNPDMEWCPPGHGDLYVSLVTTGILDKLLEQGMKYAFVSNADNLGATIDLEILGYFASKQYPFMMEATARTEADRKGGHLSRTNDGRLILRESAQCPDNEREDFQDITKYSYFNTNNLWINLESLKDKLLKEGYVLPLPPIINRKTVDPRDDSSPHVYQLESAMGAAISIFENAQALDIPRTRFAPVKTTDDLLALRSDMYELTEDYHIKPNPERGSDEILIRLDPVCYKMIDDFDSRFPSGPPSLLHCESLIVDGDILFGKGISINGPVRLANSSKQQIKLSNGLAISGNRKNTCV